MNDALEAGVASALENRRKKGDLQHQQADARMKARLAKNKQSSQALRQRKKQYLQQAAVDLQRIKAQNTELRGKVRGWARARLTKGEGYLVTFSDRKLITIARARLACKTPSAERRCQPRSGPRPRPDPTDSIRWRAWWPRRGAWRPSSRRCGPRTASSTASSASTK